MSVLDDREKHALVSALQVLVQMGPLLDDLVMPGTPASGSNAGVRASAPGPRQPVTGHPFAVKDQAWRVLKAWAPAVAGAAAGKGPRDRAGVRGWSVWLLHHVDELAGHEDARAAVEQIGQVAREVADLIDPPMSEREQQRFDGDLPRDPQVSFGTERQVTEGALVLGRQVSLRTVRRWADSGAVRSMMMPDGSRRVSLDDVIREADEMPARVAEVRSFDGG